MVHVAMPQEPAAAPDILNTMDAAIWAKEFMRIFGGERRGEIDESLMLAWFANAIMRGWDERTWRGLDWSDIDSAPQNGLPFLAFDPDTKSVFWAHWANGVVDAHSWTEDYGYEPRKATLWTAIPEPTAA